MRRRKASNEYKMLKREMDNVLDGISYDRNSLKDGETEIDILARRFKADFKPFKDAIKNLESCLTAGEKSLSAAVKMMEGDREQARADKSASLICSNNYKVAAGSLSTLTKAVGAFAKKLLKKHIDPLLLKRGLKKACLHICEDLHEQLDDHVSEIEAYHSRAMAMGAPQAMLSNLKKARDEFHKCSILAKQFGILAQEFVKNVKEGWTQV